MLLAIRSQVEVLKPVLAIGILVDSGETLVASGKLHQYASASLTDGGETLSASSKVKVVGSASYVAPSPNPLYLFHMDDNLGGIHDSVNNIEIGSGNIAGWTGTDQYKFGIGSYMSSASTNQWTLQSALSFTGDFCVDIWLNPQGTCSTFNTIMASKDTGTVFGYDTSYHPVFRRNNYSFNTFDLVSSTALTPGVMQWVAIARSGSTLELRINGSVVATATVTGTIDFGAGGGTGIFCVNESYPNSVNKSINAYMDEMRICNFYPSNLSTIPTAPYTISANPLGCLGLQDTGETLTASGVISTPASNPTIVASLTDTSETLSASAKVKVKAVSSITEGGETLSSAALVKVKATASLTDSGEALVSSAKVKVLGAASLTDSGETISSAALVKVKATSSITEGGETLSSSALIKVKATSSINEGGETLSASSLVKVKAY